VPEPVELYWEMKELFDAPIISGYGLTEAPILTMGASTDLDEDLAQTEGAAMPGVELKLVKLDGALAGTGEEGEVRAKAPQLMLGYLDSSLDADAFDDEGYFRTGDLGMLNERGMLTVTGRLKDVIIRKGENVSAKEVEDHLYRHPSIADVAVIGLPDVDRGEMVCAVVATAEGAEPITLPEVFEFLKGEGLMVQKIPERLELVPAIPRNPTGKILKNELRETYKG
jgi:cyclohexanecarboxylate-CoA ligase